MWDVDRLTSPKVFPGYLMLVDWIGNIVFGTADDDVQVPAGGARRNSHA